MCNSEMELKIKVAWEEGGGGGNAEKFTHISLLRCDLKHPYYRGKDIKPVISFSQCLFHPALSACGTRSTASDSSNGIRRDIEYIFFIQT